MSYNLPPVSDKFIHVVYEYRYFALAARSWNQFGHLGTSEAKQSADNLIPGISVFIQDSLLMRARLLIDFLTRTPSSTNPRRNNTDILLADFNLSIKESSLKNKLEEYKMPIEVHILHMTIWRDIDYRTQEATTTDGEKRQRYDWNIHNPIIINLLFRALDALDKVSNSPSDWRRPFSHIYYSVKSILDNTSTDFPMELLEKPDIRAYLKGLGLS